VVVEIFVLGRDERVDDQFGHRLDRKVETTLVGVLGDELAAAGVDPGGAGRRVLRQRVVIGQVVGKGCDVPGDACG
jgi:hypothetical protein